MQETATAPQPTLEANGKTPWLTPLVIVGGVLLGAAGTVGLLLLYDRYRHERWERDRLESLEELDRRGRAAKEREDLQTRGDHLTRCNEQFREIYRIVRAEALAHASPVILLSGDELTFLRQGERKVVAYLPPLYHELKAYSHIALAAYLVTGLEPGNAELPATRQLEIRRLLERLPDVKQELQRRDYPENLKARQAIIIDATSEYLQRCHQRAYEKRPVDSEDRVQFARNLRDLIEANVADAARIQIEALEEHVSRWYSTLTPDEAAQVKVVVVGGPMPRRDNVAVQFFEWYLGKVAEDWILYAESLFEEQKALTLLGTHLVDRDVGRAFFDEPSRMTRDLLGDAAARILSTRKKPKN